MTKEDEKKILNFLPEKYKADFLTASQKLMGMDSEKKGIKEQIKALKQKLKKIDNKQGFQINQISGIFTTAKIVCKKECPHTYSNPCSSVLFCRFCGSPI